LLHSFHSLTHSLSLSSARTNKICARGHWDAADSHVPRVQKRALAWLSLTCLDEYLEAFRKGEEQMMRRFLVGVSLGISGAFDQTTFRKKAFPELFLFSL
jgi:hypothetical protein